MAAFFEKRLTIINLQEIIGYAFKDSKNLDIALTHTSYVNENKGKNKKHNERLEFLGDAVLGLVVSRYVFENFPDLTEGEMSRLRAGVVCEPSLATCARKISLGKFLKMGKGEIASGGFDKDSVLSDTYEAVIGALYLDGGYEAAKALILKALEDEIHSLKGLAWLADCKTHLQEQLQKNSTSPISYKVIKEEGPDHQKIFTVELSHEGKTLATGEGRSKKEAEQAAAKAAIETLKLF